jgi:hypothetical protein
VVKFHFLFIPPLFYRHQSHQHRSCRSFHHHPCRCTFFVTVINIEVAAVLTVTFVVVPAWPSLHHLYHRHQHGRRSCLHRHPHRRSGMALKKNRPPPPFSLLLVMFLFSRVKKKYNNSRLIFSLFILII